MATDEYFAEKYTLYRCNDELSTLCIRLQLSSRPGPWRARLLALRRRLDRVEDEMADPDRLRGTMSQTLQVLEGEINAAVHETAGSTYPVTPPSDIPLRSMARLAAGIIVTSILEGLGKQVRGRFPAPGTPICSHRFGSPRAPWRAAATRKINRMVRNILTFGVGIDVLCAPWRE